MISLKKYLEMEAAPPPPPVDVSSLPASERPSPEAFAALLDAYCALLRGLARSGTTICAAASEDLHRELPGLAQCLSQSAAPELIRETKDHVERQLRRWSGNTAGYIKTKAGEVRDLLGVLARTAESLMERDRDYLSQLNQFTAQLQTVATLEDFTQARALILRSAQEMKACVDQMTREDQKTVAQLQAEISGYERKLQESRQQAAKDPLTGLFTRRSMEEHIEWRVANKRPFSLVLLDLDHFRQVNDTFGHVAGDELLRQLAQELHYNTRSSDAVGRWGGDEFMIVIDSDLVGAQILIKRLRRWIFGECKLKTGDTVITVPVAGSIGVAQWQAGQTAEAVIHTAGEVMHREKRLNKP